MNGTGLRASLLDAHALWKHSAPGGVATCSWGKSRLRGFFFFKCVMGELQKLDPWEQQAVVKSPYMVPAGGQQMLGSRSVVS